MSKREMLRGQTGGTILELSTYLLQPRMFFTYLPCSNISVNDKSMVLTASMSSLLDRYELYRQLCRGSIGIRVNVVAQLTIDTC